MPDLIDANDSRFHLGVLQMDQTHQEFLALVNRLHLLNGTDFIEEFSALVKHTEAHFEAENSMMLASGFAAIHEHRGEHQRLLGALKSIARQVTRGRTSIARAFVSDLLPAWFSLHAITMDSALAAHLKKTQPQLGVDIDVPVRV